MRVRIFSLGQGTKAHMFSLVHLVVDGALGSEIIHLRSAYQCALKKKQQNADKGWRHELAPTAYRPPDDGSSSGLFSSLADPSFRPEIVESSKTTADCVACSTIACSGTTFGYCCHKKEDSRTTKRVGKG
mmetsp:Transcript_17542/g.36339  ORF Transcript_17542/g.36339 Transcript_17542/m.36339 type:complete len:130 (+) Transcript_17542:236-625(+)